jgi:hypothetical protein
LKRDERGHIVISWIFDLSEGLLASFFLNLTDILFLQGKYFTDQAAYGP